MANLFVGCALGLENQLLAELEEIRPLLINESARFLTELWKLEATKGGVNVESSLIAGLQINFWSKLANRVLLRIDSFRAQSVPRLHARLKDCEIKKHLGQQKFSVKVEANKCKVSNEKTIRRLCSEIWPIEENSNLKIFLRGFDDEWIISLDTSGEHLHKRGYRQKIGAAPLRETLAALTIRQLISGQPLDKVNRTYLVDPMAGSGTLLREAFELQRPTTGRSFSFQNFTSCPKLLKTPQFWGNYKSHPLIPSRPLFQGSVAIEVEDKLQPVLQENLAPVEARIQIGQFADQTRADVGIPADAKVWAVVNPPYGERLGSNDWAKDFWEWTQKFDVDRLAIWLPEKQLAFVENRKPIASIRVSNGGIPCQVLVFDLSVNR